jgi:hypothetical protein
MITFLKFIILTILITLLLAAPRFIIRDHEDEATSVASGTELLYNNKDFLSNNRNLNSDSTGVLTISLDGNSALGYFYITLYFGS